MPVKKRKIELTIEPATPYDVALLKEKIDGIIEFQGGDLSNFYTKEEVDEIVSKIDVDIDLSDYVTHDALQNVEEQIGNKQDIIDDLDDIRAKSNSAIQEHQDISGKQDIIDDLSDIRTGAALGFTALQEHQPLDAYVKKEDFQIDYDNLKTDLKSKQNKIDDIETIRSLAYSALQEHQDISGKADVNHTHPQYLTEHQDISGKQDVISDLADIRSKANSALQTHQDISGKQDVISDLAAIRSGAALGATSIQQHQSLTNYYTKTGVNTLLNSYYTKTEITTSLNNYYKKTEIDAKLDGIDDLLIKILE